MAIKKKVRALSPEEIKEKQLKEYGPFWLNSPVMFGANLYPVDENFTNQTTILFLLDATDFSTERVMELIQNWKQKYAKLHWECVLVFQQKYAFLKNPKFIERFKHFKILLDPFDELFERFGSGKEPVAVVLKNGEMVSSIPLLPDFSEKTLMIEIEFQKSLRANDKGLPLLLPEKIAKNNLPIEQRKVQSDAVTTTGQWHTAVALLVTQNTNANLTANFKGKHLRLIAIAHPDSRDVAKVSITLNGKSLSTSVQSPIIHEDGAGASLVEINKINGIYDLIQSEVELSGEVKLTFTNAYDNGAIFYGFIFAS